MVKSKFLSSLPGSLLGQINVQLGHLTDVSLEQMVRLASVLETQSQLGNMRERVGVAEGPMQGSGFEPPPVGNKRTL